MSADSGRAENSDRRIPRRLTGRIGRMCSPGHQQTRIYVLTAVIIAHFLVELVMSNLTHSLTLLTDAYHTLYNIVAVAGFIIALKVRVVTHFRKIGRE